MAKKKTLIVDVDTNEAIKEVSDLFKVLIKGQEEAQKQQIALNKDVADIGKSAKKGEKGIKSLTKGIKGIGLAFKAAGVGLILDAFNLFKEVLGENQEIADAFTGAFEGVKIVFNQTIGVVIDFAKEISNSTGKFESLKKVGQSILKLVLTPFKLQFNNIKLALKTVQLAWEDSFLGGKDPEKIKELKQGISDTKDEIKKIATEAIQAGKDLVDNVGGAIDEVGDAASKVLNDLKKIDVQASLEAGKAAVRARNEAKIAEANLELLIAKLENQAEKQRQIRDDETKSITERKKANSDLIKLLEEQGKAAVKLAEIKLKSARIDSENDPKNIEKRTELTKALAFVESERERTTSQLSEALVNKNSLEKEGLELDNSRLESINQLSIESKKFNAERINDDVLRLETLKSIAEEEKKIELDRLQSVVDNAKAGTQAKIDAENELRAFKEQKRQEDIERDEELQQAKLDKLSQEAENEQLSFEERRALLDERRKLIEQDESISADERLERLKTQFELESELDKKKIQQQNQVLDNLIKVTGAESKIGKALLLAKQALAAKELILDATKTLAFSKQAVTRSTIAVAEGTADTAKVGFPQNVPLLIGYAAQAVGIISAIKKATGGVGGGSASQSTPTITTPTPQPIAQQSNFNIVGQGGDNQLASVISNQTQNQPPTRSYVVSSDISTQQELDRNIEDSATVLD